MTFSGKEKRYSLKAGNSCSVESGIDWARTSPAKAAEKNKRNRIHFILYIAITRYEKKAEAPKDFRF